MIPNYKKIYQDLIVEKYSNKVDDPKINHRLKNLRTTLDVIKLNDMLTNNRSVNAVLNQKLKSYDKESIMKILIFQEENKMNNTQVASHFNLSRNTITKWKKIFLFHGSLLSIVK